MANQQLGLVSSSRQGSSVTAKQAVLTGTDSFYFDNQSGQTLLLISHNNSSGAVATIDLKAPEIVDGLSVSDRLVTIQPGSVVVVGPFPPKIYAIGAFVTFSASGADVTAGKVTAAAVVNGR